MGVFVDTSAFLAVLDADDCRHAKAKKTWRGLVQAEVSMTCTNYTLVETCAVVQRRLGMEALRAFHENVLPVLVVHWVDEPVHQAAVAEVFAAGNRRLSLVDCVSFEVMRRLGIKDAFCFDSHFEEHGFRSAVSAQTGDGR
jgi:predicted nucleic acid-binding protein